MPAVGRHRLWWPAAAQEKLEAAPARAGCGPGLLQNGGARGTPADRSTDRKRTPACLYAGVFLPEASRQLLSTRSVASRLATQHCTV